MKSIRSVGVVGLGKMGGPIARHLAAAGFDAHGLDISASAIAAARQNGVRIAANPAELAARCDLVIVLTAFEEQVEQVIFSVEGLIAGARPGTIIAVAATINPDSMRDIAERLAARGLVALDIPLCRGEGPAEAGELLITGGGDAEAFEACRPAFATFANSIHLLGGPGAGQAGKMINNLILWACISANTEGFKLGDKYGISADAMRQMLLESSAQNWAMSTQVDPRYMPWAEKDMMIVLSEADRLRLSMPMAGVVKEVIKGIKIEHGQ
jgi:3-hydroxyisobutyrate dehydrogenase-like beta-hydroxyacid dehydrogenase